MRFFVIEFSKEGAEIRKRENTCHLSLKSNFVCSEETNSNNNSKTKQAVLNGMKPNIKLLILVNSTILQIMSVPWKAVSLGFTVGFL